MGIMDVLNGMQNGPSGPSQPGQGGMSPITMAILGLLAYKAVKKVSGDHTGAPSTNTAGADLSPQSMPGASSGGGLGGLLSGGLGGLGGLLAGAGAGGALSAGLGDLLNQFKNAGHGEAADSWVGNGPNKPLSPNVLEGALGGDRIQDLLRQTGLNKDDLLQGLSKYLPDAINHLTPNGRVPTGQEMGRHL